MNLTVTTMDRQKIKRKKSTHTNTKGIHQTAREETKRTRQKQRTTKTTRKKLMSISTCHAVLC